jgi:hypothetical protein
MQKSMNELIVVLERRPLVRREAAAANRRVLRIRATAADTALVARYDGAVGTLEAGAFSELDGGALQTFRRTLSASIDRMRAQPLGGWAALIATKAAPGTGINGRRAPAAGETPGTQADALRSRAMRS